MNNMLLEEAKNYFKSMNCSKFMMAREDLNKYESYKALNIPKQLEMEWREEEFLRYYEMLNNNEMNEKIWKIHNRMYDILESTKNINDIRKMSNITKSLIPKLSDFERIIIAETINGRKVESQRSGLIYLSFDLGEKELSKDFADMSLNMLDIIVEDKERKERVKRAKILCNRIKDELNL